LLSEAWDILLTPLKSLFKIRKECFLWKKAHMVVFEISSFSIYILTLRNSILAKNSPILQKRSRPLKAVALAGVSLSLLALLFAKELEDRGEIFAGVAPCAHHAVDLVG
jgi:hypothetical protein